jgi:hypothetical protein
MCNGFLNKQKNHGGCTDCSLHDPERKRANVRKFRSEIFFQILPRRWPRPNVRRSGFESFYRRFFFITERKKTHYGNLLYHFFLLNAFSRLAHRPPIFFS